MWSCRPGCGPNKSPVLTDCVHDWVLRTLEHMCTDRGVKVTMSSFHCCHRIILTYLGPANAPAEALTVLIPSRVSFPVWFDVNTWLSGLPDKLYGGICSCEQYMTWSILADNDWKYRFLHLMFCYVLPCCVSVCVMRPFL